MLPCWYRQTIRRLGGVCERGFRHARCTRRIVGEFDDTALAKEFGRRGAGIFVGPTVLSHEIEKQFSVKTLGVATGVVDEFFAISVERRVTHPCVVAITESARSKLFVRPKARRTTRPASR